MEQDPERRSTGRRAQDDDPPAQLQALIQRAATIAAQQVAAVHRRRLVRHAFLAGLVASALVVLPIALVANHQRAVAAADNARFNCSQWRQATVVLRDFIASDAKLRRDQQDSADKAEVIQGFEKIIKSTTLKRLLRRSNRLDRDAQAYWRTLIPRIGHLADVNCHAVITPGGPNT